MSDQAWIRSDIVENALHFGDACQAKTLNRRDARTHAQKAEVRGPFETQKPVWPREQAGNALSEVLVCRIHMLEKIRVIISKLISAETTIDDWVVSSSTVLRTWRSRDMCSASIVACEPMKDTPLLSVSSSESRTDSAKEP